VGPNAGGLEKSLAPVGNGTRACRYTGRTMRNVGNSGTFCEFLIVGSYNFVFVSSFPCSVAFRNSNTVLFKI
jgi:hypothetical protein